MGRPGSLALSELLTARDAHVTGRVSSRCVYPFKESGSVYQSAYLGEREDIPASVCAVDKLKYKSERVAEEAVAALA